MQPLLETVKELEKGLGFKLRCQDDVAGVEAKVMWEWERLGGLCWHGRSMSPAFRVKLERAYEKSCNCN